MDRLSWKNCCLPRLLMTKFKGVSESTKVRVIKQKARSERSKIGETKISYELLISTCSYFTVSYLNQFETNWS